MRNSQSLVSNAITRSYVFNLHQLFLLLIFAIWRDAGGSVALPAPEGLVISEFVASNNGVLADEDDEYSDWIEIYNPAEEVVNIEGWFLTNDPDVLNEWVFPGATIPGQGYLVVFASGKDRRVAGSELHTNFKLNRDGDYLALVKPDGATIASAFSPTYPRQLSDISYGVLMATDTLVMVPEDGSGKVFFPTDGSLGESWKSVGFDDSAWSDLQMAIGFDRPEASEIDPPAEVVLADVTKPGDPIVGTSGNSPAGEEVNKAIDDTTATKYLNFDIFDTGFTVTPSIGESVVVGLRFSSGNDAPDRDPTSFTLHGSNNGTTFTPIASGPIPEFLGRFETVEVGFENDQSYAHYRILFPTLRGPNASCCMQISEVEFLGQSGPSVASFSKLIVSDVEGSMYGSTSSAYLRIPFEASSNDALSSLALHIRYDDGFVAYLNGVEVARGNAPQNALYDSIAISDRTREDAVSWERFSLVDFKNLVQTGANVLAIHGMNDSVNGPDFLLQVRLENASIVVGQTGYFDDPTPGELNSTISLGLVAAPSMNQNRGFYTASFALALTSATEDATIRYTTDGSVPTIESGIDYVSPIQVHQTSVIRAVAFKEGWRTSETTTHSYVFIDDVVNQTASSTINAGFPSSWNGQGSDYGLDGRVVGRNGTDDFGGKYANELIASLLSLPTMSLVIDNDEMFGPQGIYSNPNDRGDAWERGASLELIFPDGTEGFQEDAGIRIQGGAFRRFDLSLKKSFRMIFSEEHGATKLKYPLFGPDAADEFDNFILRANSNDAWRWGRENTLYVRDAFAQVTMREMGRVAPHSRFVHLYINGFYWGLYNPVERPDATFSSNYYGGDKDDWDALNQDSAPDGNYDAWNRLLELVSGDVADNAVYQLIQGNNPDGTRNPDYEDLLDVENMIDYMIMNFFVGNNDWPHRNFWMGRDRNNGDGFKFYPWDTETTMGLNSDLNANRTGVNNSAAVPYGALRGNAEFRTQFGDQVHKHFFNGGVFAVNPNSPVWDTSRPEDNRPAARLASLADSIRSAIVAESARWGDQLNSYPYTRDEHWEAELDFLLNTYHAQRAQIVLQQFRSASLYPNVAAPIFSQHGGPVPTGYRLSMSAQNGLVFYTTDGSDPRSPIEVTTISSEKLIQSSAAKRVFIPTTTNGGSQIGDSWWDGSAFDDSAWMAGTGGVGYEGGTGYESYIDIDVRNAMQGVNTAALIRIPFSQESLDLNAFNFMTLSIRFDDGFAAFLNGVKIASVNAPEELEWFSNADAQNDDSSAVLLADFDVSQFLSALREGDNLLAIQGLNVSTGSSDFLIDAELSVGRREIKGGEVIATEYSEPVELDDLVTIKARTFDGAEWSALNEATFTVGSPRLIISELNYHPASPSPAEVALGFNDPDDFEFIELFNPGSTTYDLSDVYFSDGVVFAFADSPVSELGAGEYVLVVRNPAAYETRFGSGGPVAGEYSGGLSNSGERVALSDSSGLILEFSYGVSDPWPPSALDEGRSLQLIADNADPSLPASWRASSEVGGSPGQASVSGPLLVERVYMEAGQLHLVFNAEVSGSYSIRSSSDLGSNIWDSVESVDLAGASGETDVAISIPIGVSQSYFQIVRTSLP